MQTFARVFLSLIALTMNACAAVKFPAAVPVARVEVRDELQSHFRAEGLLGTFVLVELDAAKATVVAPRLATRRYSPASTFKLPNTLIGLETGAVTERTVFPWDGKKRWSAGWNRSLDLPGALKASALWWYQELARRVGKEKMQSLLDGFGYGNGRIGGAVDAFWIDGSLKVSPVEQIAFLKKLVRGELPVRAEHMATLRRLMTLEEGPGFVLRGKTGTNRDGDRWLAWLVGTVERGPRTFLYAMLATAPRARAFRELLPARMRVARGLLRALGALPPA